MPTTKDTQESNMKLAQLKLLLDDDMMKSKYNINFILDKMNNINCKVVATDYLQLYSVKSIGSTALHFALSKMNLEAFEILLSYGAGFTIKNSNGSTALHQIVEDRQCFTSDRPSSDHTFVHSVVSAHTKYSNYENPVNRNGLSHFHIACAANNVDVVKEFLRNGVLIDHTVNENSPLFPGFSPLHFAAKYYAFEVVKVLLSYGANTRVENVEGITPLHIVLQKKLNLINNYDFDDICTTLTDELADNFEKILTAFFKAGSKDDMVVVDKWGMSSFHVACTLNDSKIAEKLLPKVVNINHFVNMDSQLWPGYTSLHFAALCNIDTVKLLALRGADFTAKDAHGITPLDVCTKLYGAEVIYEIISLNPVTKNIVLSDGKTKLTELVFAMRDPNEFDIFFKKLDKDITISNSSLWPGYTPMHLAVLFSKTYIMVINENGEELNQEILINLHKQNPAMRYSKDADGRTPLHLAFRLNKSDMLQELFGKYEKLDLVDHVEKDGLSYVHIAAASEEPRSLEKLLSTAANVNAVYRGQTLLSASFLYPRTLYSGSTPLHFAVANGRIEAVKMLVKQGADVYARDANDMTPIHLLMSNDKACNVLTSPNLKDSVVSGIGLSHLHGACWCNEPEIAERLLDDGANINGIVTYKSIANVGPNRLLYLEKYDGYSPLLMAYKGNHYGVVMMLLKRGADVFVKYTEGKVFLHRIMELNSREHFDLFINILIKRIDVQTHLKDDIGMTELHIACMICNIDEIEKLLGEGADVDARIPADSAIFQGYTPLHVLIHVSDSHPDNDVDRVIKIILKAGADVTLPDVKSETAVDAVWSSLNRLSDEEGKSKYVRINTLLEAQRDFDVNPTNVGSISHFHIACHVCNVGVVQKFLSHGKVNINQTIDFFHKSFPGYSALQLTAGSRSSLCGASKQLRTIDLLLNHGANIHAEDKHGDTPLHECARLNSLDLFERLVRGDADANTNNVWGNTPLYYYLSSNNASVQELKVLLRFGCRLNVFNPVTGEGYVGVAACKFKYEDMHSFLDIIIINFKHEMEMENFGRTVKHNIVSTDSPKILVNQYANLIEQISEFDCDVDGQDNSGRTALHMAVKFYNYKGVFGLLMTGADINITDAKGKTAFACDFDICQRCKDHDDSWFDDGDDEGEKTCEHLLTLETLAFHVKKLQTCGLHVDKQNEELAYKAFVRLNNENTEWENFLRELESIKSIKIEPHALTLNKFLSENEAVADYPTMSQMKREDINKFFSASKVSSQRENFPEVAGILQLQYRKARARPELVELAKNAMELLMGFRLPEICSHVIVVLLTNLELKSLIASVD